MRAIQWRARQNINALTWTSAETVEPKMNEPILYTVPEAMTVLRIGRSLFYELVKEKKLRAVKIAGKTLVRKDDLDSFISSLAA
ncbi:MAG: helix-turn-helix domain-containing protein [Notoacmeibacter sp.]|nr:helix-turn-helix domain-containing protein [Notoacmeibacter sp.]